MPKVNAGPRVIALADPVDSRSANVIIPGDVLWCEIRGKYVVGQKVSAERPAAWMAPEWEKAGFFAIDPSALHPGAFSDDEMYGGAVRWFGSEELLNEAVAAIR